MTTSPFDIPAPPLTAVPDPDVDPPADEQTGPAPEPETPADTGWKHEVIDFMDTQLEVRKPTQQAIGAFGLGTSKHASPALRTEMTSMFLLRHVSADTAEYVFGKLMDPDDGTWTMETLGKLVREIMALTTAAAAG